MADKFKLKPGATYRIINAGHGAVVSVIDGNVYGPLAAFEKADSGYQRWKVSITKAGDNPEVILSSAGGSVAGILQEASGAPLIGSAPQTTWELIAISENQYQIKTLDGIFFWALNRPDKYYPILIRHISEIKDHGLSAEWRFEAF